MDTPSTSLTPTDPLPEVVETKDITEEVLQTELAKLEPTTRGKIVEKFVLAALGSIPWVGGYLSAAASLKGDAAKDATDALQTRWLEEHSAKIAALRTDIDYILGRFRSLGEAITERIQSEEYLRLVRSSFRVWDAAETDTKRKYIRQLVSNAAGSTLSSDDVVALFIDWLDKYSLFHFAVIGEVYRSKGITRLQMWQHIKGSTIPRDDSADADLFKLLINDLTLGYVIRQERETNAFGEYMKAGRARQRGSTSSTMQTPFEDTKGYELTELGEQFVHYTLTEYIDRLNAGQGVPPTSPTTPTGEAAASETF